MELSIQSYKLGLADPSQEIDSIASKAVDRINLLKGADLRGRVSADAAFSFALAGVTSNQLFDMLLIVALKELRRFGRRSQCKPKQICHMVEKLAAAGCLADSQTRGFVQDELLQLACQILREKGHGDLALQYDKSFGFYANMPLLWLWRFSAKQSKITPPSYLQTASKKLPDWDRLFKDPTRPLVIDLGCGMGVALLGLATMTSSDATVSDTHPNGIHIEWPSCNFLGVELHTSLTRFASGLSLRWEVSHKLQLVSIPAETLIEYVKDTYPGCVQMVMISNPTPYRLQDQPTKKSEEEYSDTLCGDNHSTLKNNFMVTTRLLEGISSVLEKKGGYHEDSMSERERYLLLQSNSEDVAIFMKSLAEETMACFSCMPMPSPILANQDIVGKLTWRTKRMLQRNHPYDETDDDGSHQQPRAVGQEWNKEEILPARAKSETEVSCLLNDTPIHRCVLLKEH